MQTPTVARNAGLTLALMALGSTFAVAQVPTRASAPRLVPTRETVNPTPGQPTTEAAEPVAPTEAAQPAAPAPSGAPATAPAPVTAAPGPSGVTQLPPVAAPPATASSSSAATAARSYSAGSFSLTVDGINAGALGSVDGGVAVGKVVAQNLGPDNMAKKHLAGVSIEPLSVEVGLDSKPVMDWIAATWKGNYSRKNVSVQAADYHYNIVGTRQFSNALIVGTTIPALDLGTGKTAGSLTVTLAPEQVREMSGSGTAQSSTNRMAKRWMSSNFRLELGDLPTKRVTRIESFTVGAKVSEDPVGEMRDYEKQPTAIVFPDLKVTLSQVDAAPWAQWHEDFVIKGNAGDDKEKNGAIVFLDPAMKEELGRVNLYNCGIFRFGAEPQQRADRDRPAKVTADLYCERMELSTKAVP